MCPRLDCQGMTLPSTLILKIPTQSSKGCVRKESGGSERKCTGCWKITCLVNLVKDLIQRNIWTYLLRKGLVNHLLQLANQSYSFRVPLLDDPFYFISTQEMKQFTIPLLQILCKIKQRLHPQKDNLIRSKQLMRKWGNPWISQLEEFKKLLRWKQRSRRKRDRRNSRCIQKFCNNK